MNYDSQKSSDAIRHRLLEGMLTRLARSPDRDQFILRGGMLLRLWFHKFDRSVYRPASDLDLVSTVDFEFPRIEKQLASLLIDTTVADGIYFNPRRFQIKKIWADTDFPGVRMYAFGKVKDGDVASDSGPENDIEFPIGVDVTFGESLVPAPQVDDYPIEGQTPASLLMCRPEAIAARKLHALCDMGLRHWRPKDLNDVRLLLECTPMDDADLIAAIKYSFNSRGDSADKSRTLFGAASHDSWWNTKTASARWRDFANAGPMNSFPDELNRVVDFVSGKLDPLLRSM